MYYWLFRAGMKIQSWLADRARSQQCRVLGHELTEHTFGDTVIFAACDRCNFWEWGQ